MEFKASSKRDGEANLIWGLASRLKTLIDKFPKHYYAGSMIHIASSSSSSSISTSDVRNNKRSVCAREVWEGFRLPLLRRQPFEDHSPSLPHFRPLPILPKLAFRNQPPKFTRNLARNFTRVRPGQRESAC